MGKTLVIAEKPSVQTDLARVLGKELGKFSKKGKTVGSFEVLGKASDPTLGGLAFDARIVDHMAEEFNGIWDKARGDGQKKDVREIPRAMAKLRVQANKVKHVLSANSDFPIFIDALHDDVNYESHLSRSSFNEICKDLLDRATAPITDALAAADHEYNGQLPPKQAPSFLIPTSNSSCVTLALPSWS